jgi:hypothetical protein
MAALVVGLALALVAVAGFTQSHAQPAPPPSPGIVARGTLSPRVLLFGDPMTARIDVLVDRRSVDPAMIRLQAPFPPFEPLSETSSRRDRGDVTELRYTMTLQCVTIECLPPLTRKRFFVFPLTQVVYREASRRGGFATTIPIQFPAVGVASRLSEDAIRTARRRTGPLRVIEGPASGVGLQEALRLVRDDSRQLPAASYNVSPTLLVAILLVLAGLLALAAVVLVVRYVRPPAAATVRPTSPVLVLSPLEHALGELDVALADGQVDRQRKALELLAHELGRSGEDALAAEARQVAWGQGSVARDDAQMLARTVRLSLNGGRGGDPE